LIITLKERMHKFVNRHGQDILFGWTGTNSIEVECDTLMMRYGLDDKGKNDIITFVDPCGGPLISVGDDMGDYNNAWTGLKIVSIDISNGIKLHVK